MSSFFLLKKSLHPTAQSLRSGEPASILKSWLAKCKKNVKHLLGGINSLKYNFLLHFFGWALLCWFLDFFYKAWAVRWIYSYLKVWMRPDWPVCQITRLAQQYYYKTCRVRYLSTTLSKNIVIWKFSLKNSRIFYFSAIDTSKYDHK